MPYYPEHSFVVGLATVRRERSLPPGVVGSEVQVRNGDVVEAQTVLLDVVTTLLGVGTGVAM